MQYFQQSDEEIENLHKQINNLTEENDMLKLEFQEKVLLCWIIYIFKSWIYNYVDIRYTSFHTSTNHTD